MSIQQKNRPLFVISLKYIRLKTTCIKKAWIFLLDRHIPLDRLIPTDRSTIKLFLSKRGYDEEIRSYSLEILLTCDKCGKLNLC